jgi:hypothetical protein
VKDIDIIRARVRGLFQLRQMLYHLTMNDGSSSQILKENPIKKDEREVLKWLVGGSYEVPGENELTLCNVKAASKMQVRYVMADPEYFILIEPDFSQLTQDTVHQVNAASHYRVKVHIKQPLKHIESIIDKTEPRNLNIGFPVFLKPNTKPLVEEVLLFFENGHKCAQVKNKIDQSKKAWR